MSSMWASTLTSLDDSLAALEAVAQQLEAATPVDLPQTIERLKGAAESARSIRNYVMSELPDAEWRDRQGLDGLLQTIDLQHLRSEVLALADELEKGEIVHRRAARVTQLNELRAEAVEELRTLAAAETAPPHLPGPVADRWVDWACGLQEPEDTTALQTLRAGYPWLDEFVAALEPGMWATATPAVPQTSPPKVAAPSATATAATAAVMATAAAAAAAPALAPVPKAVPTVDPAVAAAREMEQRKTRLLDLATELEGGSVVHNRAMRVTQVTHLRDQAIQELRFQALVAREPAVLPGPEPDKWVQWACTLEEPDDAEALQTLRDGFVHLDEFVANLEPDMWVPAPPPQPVAPAATESSQEAVHPEKSRVETDDDDERSEIAAKAGKPAVANAAFSRILTSAKSGASGLSESLPPKLASFWRAKWRLLLPGAVLLIVLLAAMQWQLHRTHASNDAVRATEEKAPETAAATPSGSPGPSTATTAAPATTPPDVKEKTATPKNSVVETRPAPAPPPQQERQVSVLNDRLLRTPQAMPKTAARAEEGTGEAPGLVPGALPGGVPNSVTNVVKDVPVSTPKLPQQKIRVSSGVAQGQLIHQVQPAYPAQAKLAGISGTVVLQAVVSKDGTVQNVKALRGPSILIPSAVDAVKQWRYKPFAVNGEPSEAEVEINLKFASQQ